MNTLLEQIEHTAVLLYQNKEQEGMTETAQLLQQFQTMIQTMTQEQLASGGNFALIMMRELLENYERQDVLGIADCLMEKSVLFVQFLNETNQ